MWEDSRDDRSSCSSGTFDEFAAGACGSLRAEDLERGASSDSEEAGLVFDGDGGDGGAFLRAVKNLVHRPNKHSCLSKSSSSSFMLHASCFQALPGVSG